MCEPEQINELLGGARPEDLIFPLDEILGMKAAEVVLAGLIGRKYEPGSPPSLMEVYGIVYLQPQIEAPAMGAL